MQTQADQLEDIDSFITTAVLSPADNVEGGAGNLSDVGPLSLPQVVSECAITNSSGDGVCSDDRTVAAISQMLPPDQRHGTRPEIVQRAAALVGADDERGVIMSTQFASTAGTSLQQEALAKYFKIQGPTDVSLLSNINIDKTLVQWNGVWRDFYPYNYNMRDYAEYGGSLATVHLDELYRRGFRTAACVINSDYNHNRGKHWMALFVDMRNSSHFTVEFFNSSGNHPLPEFARWMTNAQQTLSKIAPTESIVVARVKHQYSRTECGVYALYYIYSRLNGISYEQFRDNPVPDEVMFEFRQHLFYDPKRPAVNGSFDINAFQNSTSVQMEESRHADVSVSGGSIESTTSEASECVIAVRVCSADAQRQLEEWCRNTGGKCVIVD